MFGLRFQVQVTGGMSSNSYLLFDPESSSLWTLPFFYICSGRTFFLVEDRGLILVWQIFPPHTVPWYLFTTVPTHPFSLYSSSSFILPLLTHIFTLSFFGGGGVYIFMYRGLVKCIFNFGWLAVERTRWRRRRRGACAAAGQPSRSDTAQGLQKLSSSH